jgi:hypothetical protein
MGDLDLESLDFLREFYALRIGQWFALIVDVTNVQYFAHKLNNRLGFVESRGRNWKQDIIIIHWIFSQVFLSLTVNVEHHFPL